MMEEEVQVHINEMINVEEKKKKKEEEELYEQGMQKKRTFDRRHHQ
jgi:hypothetical protein